MSEVVYQHQSAPPVDQRSEPPAVFRLWERRAVVRPFAAAGLAGIIGGGLLAAAIAAPAPTRHGVWASAYLVLVIGVGQIVLAVGQALLAESPPSVGLATTTAALFNTANIAIVLGVVTGHIAVFDVGSVLLLIALVLFLHGVRRGRRAGWPLYAYRLFVAGLVISIPIGLLITILSG